MEEFLAIIIKDFFSIFSPRGTMGRGAFFLFMGLSYWSFLSLPALFVELVVLFVSPVVGWPLQDTIKVLNDGRDIFLLSVIFGLIAYCSIMKRLHDLELPDIFGQVYILLIFVFVVALSTAISFACSYSSPGPFYDYLVSIGLMRSFTFLMAKIAFCLFIIISVATMFLLFKSNDGRIY